MKELPENSQREQHLIEWHRILNLLKRDDIKPYPPFEQDKLLDLFFSTVVLILAIDGENADITAKLDSFLHFVETPLGNTLALCAGEARKRGPFTWAAFKASITVGGADLVRAVAAWLKVVPNPSHLENFHSLKTERALTEAEADFYDRAIRAEMPPGLEALESQFRQWQRLNEAQKKKTQRSKKPRSTDPFKAVIQRDWITFALWPRTTKSILRCYPWMPQADAKEQYASFKKIDDAISKLGFSSSRKPEHSAKIEEAEEAMKKLISSHL